MTGPDGAPPAPPGADGRGAARSGPGIALRLDGHGRLVLVLPGGDEVAGVVPVRAFPLTDPDGYVALCDERGREAWSLPDPSVLGPADREVLQSELARREFLPRVTRVVSVDRAGFPSAWTVRTDRGPATFTVTGEDAIRRLGERGVLVTDARGIRWVVPDVRALDARGRRLLSRYL